MLTRKINKKYLVLGALITVLVVAGLCCAWVFRETPPPPLPAKPAIPPKAQTHVAPSTNINVGAASTKQPESMKTVETETITPATLVAGNLGDLTALRAELDKTKLEVAILQEKEKLSPKQPQILKTVPAPAPEPAKSVQPQQPQLSNPSTPPVVLSIQAVDGHAAAIIRIHGQLQTVHTGDHIGSSIVNKVSREGVFIQNGKQTIQLGFDE